MEIHWEIVAVCSIACGLIGGAASWAYARWRKNR